MIFGEWLRRGIRDQVVIIGKGSHHNEFRKRVTPFDLAADIADTPARMQVPALDMWMFHRDDPGQEIGPLVRLNAPSMLGTSQPGVSAIGNQHAFNWPWTMQLNMM